MLPVYGKFVPGEVMRVFKRLLWRKFNQRLLQHLFSESANLLLQWYSLKSQVLKGWHCFSLCFKADIRTKLCWFGGKKRWGLNGMQEASYGRQSDVVENVYPLRARFETCWSQWSLFIDFTRLLAPRNCTETASCFHTNCSRAIK